MLERVLYSVENQAGFEILQLDFPTNGSTIPILGEATKGKPYLMMKQGEKGFVLLENDNLSLPSQFLRKLTAEIFEGENAFWNWKLMSATDLNLVKERLSTTYSLWYE